MPSPYKLSGPACVSVSGGRTSMYLMRRILDEGPVDNGVFFVFADTGRELPETHDFINECERRWGHRIHRVERKGMSAGDSAFDRLLSDKHAAYLRRGQQPQLPGPKSRYCTIELKRAPAERFMAERGLFEYDQILGIRADERRRAASIMAKAKESRPVHPDGSEPWMSPEMSMREHLAVSAKLSHVKYEYVLPLVEDGITERDVLTYWSRSSFDLQLEPHEGNCDDCFMKATWKRLACIRKRPELVKPWIDDEDRFGSQYRMGGQSYRKQEALALARLPILDLIDDSLGECLCHD